MLTTGAPLPLNPTSPNLAVEPSRTPTRRPALPRPEPVRPGLKLRAAIDTVLSGLGADNAESAAQTLVTGLAWTAAAGETCQIPTEVAAVRRAIADFGAGRSDSARASLADAARALRTLHSAPALPAPRGSSRDD